MSFDFIPQDVLVYEIWPLLSDGDRFVMRFVNKRCRDLALSYTPLRSSPTSDFIRCGHLKVLQWDQASTHPCSLSIRNIGPAAHLQNFDMVNYLLERGVPLSPKDVSLAVAMRNLPLAEYLITTLGCSHLEWAPHALAAAAVEGSLDLYQFVIDRCPVDWYDEKHAGDAFLCAVRSKNITRELMEFMSEKIASPHEFSAVVRDLASLGDPGLVRWAIQKGFPLIGEIYYVNASQSGNVELLEIAKSEGLPLTSPSRIWDCFGYAAAQGTHPRRSNKYLHMISKTSPLYTH